RSTPTSGSPSPGASPSSSSRTPSPWPPTAARSPNRTDDHLIRRYQTGEARKPGSSGGLRQVLGEVGLPLITIRVAQGGREMKFWETVTGSDLNRERKAFEARAEALPEDYRAAWGQITVHLFPYSNFTGRNLMPILDGALGLLEESAADGQ